MSSKDRQFTGASMTAEGMQFNGAIYQPVIDKCEGCNRVREFEGQNFCIAYTNPSAKWAIGNCNFATHVRSSQGGQSKVNPLKASKRAAKGGR